MGADTSREELQKEVTRLENRVVQLEQNVHYLNQRNASNEDKLKKYQEKEKERKKELESIKNFRWGLRRVEWTSEGYDALRREVLSERYNENEEKIKLRILVFGLSGSGKSTLCNGFRTALHNQTFVSNYHSSSMSVGGMTKDFSIAEYGSHLIIDMQGIFESDKVTDSSIRDIASGKMNFTEMLNDDMTPKSRSDGVLRLEDNDVSCVVIVLQAGQTLGPEVKRQIEVIVQLAGKGVIGYHVVLTHVDRCDVCFKNPENLPNIFENPDVLRCVKATTVQTGIPPSNISVARNYVNECEPDLYTNVLLLTVLKRINHQAFEQIQQVALKKKLSMRTMTRSIE